VHPPDKWSSRSFVAPLLVWAIGIVYGSLVPFDFHPHPLAAAWHNVLQARWLVLDMWGRADWIANLLIFIPLSFLMTALWGRPRTSAATRVMASVCVLAACAVFAVTIEFIQVFFPPRTVSLNDIVAETLGAGLGVALWWTAGDKLSVLVAQARGSGRSARNAILACYVLAYLVLSLFPYDFLVSRAEFAAKIASDEYGLLFAPRACGSVFRCVVKSLAEVLAVTPFGVGLRLIWAGSHRHEMLRAGIAGAALGLLIEAAQFLTASGITQGLSVVTRAAGFCLGYYAFRFLQTGSAAVIRPWLRPLVVCAAPPYLIALALVNGVHPGRWMGWSDALARLGEVHFLPFYYYYFTTETRAMVSLLGVIGLYAPIGVAAGLWTSGRDAVRPPRRWLVACAGGVICAAIEFLKLLDPARHPDVTDVLIAAVAAVLGLAAFRLLTSSFEEGESPPSRHPTGV
jgi:glycopeptide antibiotics resistance protein